MVNLELARGSEYKGRHIQYLNEPTNIVLHEGLSLLIQNLSLVKMQREILCSLMNFSLQILPVSGLPQHMMKDCKREKIPRALIRKSCEDGSRRRDFEEKEQCQSSHLKLFKK